MKILPVSILLLIVSGSALSNESGAADADENALAAARAMVKHHHGGDSLLFIMADRLEYNSNEGEPFTAWEADLWYGGDLNKLWLKTEGEYAHDLDKFHEAEIQALYSRAVSPFWDLQAGLRYDITPAPGRGHGVIGLRGLAPYWFEVDVAGFVSHEGDLSVRVELEYELLLTQRLILQPRVELSAALQEDAASGTGSGLNTISAGLRLRYEIKREIAPYIGVSWGKAFAETADFRRAQDEQTAQFSFIAGLRFWY